jgi:hypothetical protein
LEKVELAYLWGRRRQEYGPVTQTLYVFNPWAKVWDVDANIMLGLTKKKGKG